MATAALSGLLYKQFSISSTQLLVVETRLNVLWITSKHSAAEQWLRTEEEFLQPKGPEGESFEAFFHLLLSPLQMYPL